jgi:hypothetical protein
VFQKHLSVFYLDLLGFAYSYLDAFNDLDLLGFAWICLDLLGFTWIYLDWLGFAYSYLDLLIVTWICL